MCPRADAISLAKQPGALLGAELSFQPNCSATSLKDGRIDARCLSEIRGRFIGGYKGERNFEHYNGAFLAAGVLCWEWGKQNFEGHSVMVRANLADSESKQH